MQMWIFQNDSFLSVVAHREQRGKLLVRSRILGDIEAAIPGAAVFEDLDADYRYRAVVDRKQLKRAMDRAVDRIDYGNFKDSVAKSERDRHDAYMGVWRVMAQWFGAYIGKRVRNDGDRDDHDDA